MSSLILRSIGIAALTCGVVSGLQAATSMPGFEDYPVVADRELDQMRGGFETRNGALQLSFSFGIERATFLNGELVATTTLAIPTFPVAFNSLGGGATAFNPVNVIQNGPGNVFALPSVRDLPTSVLTVIQNTLDNQVIGNVTVINASVTSRDFLRSLTIQSSLNQTLFNSLR